MTPERTPRDADAPSLAARAMTALLRGVLRFPLAIVALATGLAVLATAYSASQLGYKTSRHDLVNPDNEYGRLWNEYVKEFGEEDDAVVVVEGENRAAVVPVLRELASQLANENKHFHAVLHGVNLEKVRSKGLHYLPPEELRSIEGFLDEAGAIVSGGWSRLTVGGMVQGMCTRLRTPIPQMQTRRAPLSRINRASSNCCGSHRACTRPSTNAAAINLPGRKCRSRSPR
jgi:hypothetical protein